MRREIDSCLEDFVATDGKATATIVFDEGFSGFKGHFPEQPILPGVCQIALVLTMAERMRGVRQSLIEVVNAKFVSMVKPGQQLTVECSLTDGLLRAKLQSEGSRVAEFRLKVEDA